MKTLIKTLLVLLMSLAAAIAAAAVNINTASADELKTLPGIGPAKAKAIVEYREKNGGANAFKTPEDLKKVKGIGDGIFMKIKEQVAVSGKQEKAQNQKAVK